MLKQLAVLSNISKIIPKILLVVDSVIYYYCKLLVGVPNCLTEGLLHYSSSWFDLCQKTVVASIVVAYKIVLNF